MSRVARPAGWPDRSWPRSVPRVTRLVAGPAPSPRSKNATPRAAAGLSPNAIAMIGILCALAAIVLIAIAPAGVVVGLAIGALLVLGFVLPDVRRRRRAADRAKRRGAEAVSGDATD